MVSDLEFEGSLVLESLAAVGRLDEFSQAVDADDRELAASLMRSAGIDDAIIAMVLARMQTAD